MAGRPRKVVREQPVIMKALSLILNERLGDLREGRCSYGFFYNSNACCTGLDRMSHLQPFAVFYKPYAHPLRYQRVNSVRTGKAGATTFV